MSALVRNWARWSEPLHFFLVFRALAKVCAVAAPVALLCAGCAPYSGVNGSFYKTVDYQPRSHTKDEVMILLASTAPVAEHYHVGEVRVSRGTMDSDTALYDAMRDLGVTYGFDGVNYISCGDNYSLTEPYICTGTAFVLSKQQVSANKIAPAQQSAMPAEPVRYYGEENSDFGVKPQRELQTNVGTPTPLQLPTGIGSTISTEDLNQLLTKVPLLVDVLESEHQYSIRGAFRIPEGGRPGDFADRNQETLAGMLGILVDGPDTPIVFFCAGVRCWESYNAVLRAHAAGHRNLYWYRGGLAAWQEAGLPLQSREEVEENEPFF